MSLYSNLGAENHIPAAAPIYMAVKGDIFDVRYGNFRMCLRCIIIQLCQYGVDRRIGDASLGVKFKHPSHLSHHSLHEYTICDDVYPSFLTMSHLFADYPGKYIVSFNIKFSCISPLYVFFSCHSFGGMEMYGKGCTYHPFAGRDASRALAKMSFDVEHLDSPCTDDLTGNYVNV